MPDTTSSFFTTNDGVRLHSLEAGRGRPLIILPAWSVPAAQMREIMAPLSRTHRCGGSHFMFLENPNAFAAAVEGLLAGLAP